MTRTSRALFLSTLAALTAACGGSGDATTETTDTTGDETVADTTPPPPPPPEPARIRVIHAAFDPSAASIALAFDGADAAIPSLAYEFSSAYVELPAGSHAASVRANDAELIGADLDLSTEGGWYTAIAYSTADFPAAVQLTTDRPEAPAEGTAAVRLFHGIVGLTAIDVCTPGETARADGTPIFADVQPGALAAAPDGTSYASVPTGAEITLQLRAQNATPCHGRVQGVARITPVSGNYTLVAVGRTTGRPRVDRELLLCADPPATDTSCAAVPIAAR
jgi:hypothetical protein